MTQEQREKLVFCTGLIAGLSWIVESSSVAEALQSVQEDIEMLLKEDASKRGGGGGTTGCGGGGF